jgi:hypothetical protein
MTEEKAIAKRPSYYDLPLQANGQVQLTTMEHAYMISDWVVKAGFAPKGKNTPQQVFIAGQMGAALGFDFWTSLTNVMVVNGMPTVWGDALLGKVRSLKETTPDGQAVSQLEYFAEYIEGNPPELASRAICIVKRLGVGFEIDDLFAEKRELLTADPVMLQRAGWTVGMFSGQDAKTAGLLGKSGPWSNYPARMMAMRARAFALRNAFPDALKGIHAMEEFQGTQVERDQEARDLSPSNYSEERDATDADYQTVDFTERSAQESGPAAGLNVASELPEDDEPDPGPGPEGGSKPEPEIVDPGASQAVEKPAEDPLSPESLAGAPERPQTREAAPASQDGYVMPEIDPNDDELLPDDAVEEVEEESVPDPGADKRKEILATAGESVEDRYWQAVWQHAGSDVQTIQAFRSYGKHMLNLLDEPAEVFYKRAIENIEGHVANCKAWHAKNARVAASKPEPGPKGTTPVAEDHSPAEKAVAAAHKEAPDMFTPEVLTGSGDGNADTFDVPTRLLYTKDMLENPELQQESDPAFDPIRYANVKSKRGKGVKAYYERHLDRFLEVLSSDNIDWAEWIMGPHRGKWNSIALTRSMPFILDEKKRELTQANAPETAGDITAEMQMRSLKDKIKSYQNFDEVMFRRVLNALKVSGNPMTIQGAELLLKALEEEYRRTHK